MEHPMDDIAKIAAKAILKNFFMFYTPLVFIKMSIRDITAFPNKLIISQRIPKINFYRYIFNRWISPKLTTTAKKGSLCIASIRPLWR